MLWGDSSDRIEAWTSTVVEGYANCAMGFNEYVYTIIRSLDHI